MSELIRVWIQGQVGAGMIRAMLAGYEGSYRFRPSQNIYTADMILYTGGADVDPQLYNEQPLPVTHYSPKRDEEDMTCYKIARRANKFQVGICRGSQFLNVMNGGKMWQDVDNHTNEHLIEDCQTKEVFAASSTHHQQIILGRTAQLLAFCQESTQKTSYGKYWSIDLGPSVDVEAYWYHESHCLGVQWHPEYGPKECRDQFFKYIEKFYKQDRVQSLVPDNNDSIRCM